ncbi:MAG: pirin family protein [Xanthomonadales bacterium]|nr:pirin family protein [Xanthomonadales bacterium]
MLPHAEKRAVGPFVFFDHMGPAEFAPGKGIQVRPHPHIGLSTVTYLFEGEIIHRDSLGYVQPIRPGAINLMTAGRGIVHSERAGEDLHTTSSLHGIQIWIGLPEEDEECDPAFEHVPSAEIPRFIVDGVGVALVMGSAFGRTSPVRTYSATLYLDCAFPADSHFALPDGWQEVGAYVVSGALDIGDKTVEAGEMAILERPGDLKLSASTETRAVIVGGDPLGKRTVWWNLVSSSKERIEQAKRDWVEGRFDMVPGDPEFIPLPDR